MHPERKIFLREITVFRFHVSFFLGGKYHILIFGDYCLWNIEKGVKAGQFCIVMMGESSKVRPPKDQINQTDFSECSS